MVFILNANDIAQDAIDIGDGKTQKHKDFMNSEMGQALVNEGYNQDELLNNIDNDNVVLEGAENSYDTAGWTTFLQDEGLEFVSDLLIDGGIMGDSARLGSNQVNYGTSVSAFSPFGGALKENKELTTEDKNLMLIEHINSTRHNMTKGGVNWLNLAALEPEDQIIAMANGHAIMAYDDYFNLKDISGQPLALEDSYFEKRRGPGDATLITKSIGEMFLDPVNLTTATGIARATWGGLNTLFGREIASSKLGVMGIGAVEGGVFMSAYDTQQQKQYILSHLWDQIDWEATNENAEVMFQIYPDIDDTAIREKIALAQENSENGVLDEALIAELNEDYLELMRGDFRFGQLGISTVTGIAAGTGIGAAFKYAPAVYMSLNQVLKAFPNQSSTFHSGFIFPEGVNPLSRSETQTLRKLSKGDPKLFKQYKDQVIEDKYKEYKKRNPNDGWEQLEFKRFNKGKIEYKQPEYNFSNPENFEQVSDNLINEVEEIVRLAEDGDERAINIIEQAGWYRDVAGSNRETFGGITDTVMDVTAATSPGVKVQSNMDVTMDIMKRYSSGEFDKEIAAYKARIDAGQTVSNKKLSLEGLNDFPKLRNAAGKLYNTNSLAATEALLGMFGRIEAGKSPKTIQFMKNLTGQDSNATIDVWAARFIRRLTGQKAIIPAAEKGVGGKHLTGSTSENPRIGGDFGAGQSIFNLAKDKINNSDLLGRIQNISGIKDNIKADDLQAIGWYIEQGRTDYVGGSIIDEINKRDLDRTTVGISAERPGARPTNYEQAEFAAPIAEVLNKDQSVKMSKTNNTYGRFMGENKRALDIEFVHTKDFNDTELVDVLKAQAKEKDQDSFFVSKVIKSSSNESSNIPTRPGMEIYFDSTSDMKFIDEIVEEINKFDVDGFTFISDMRQADKVEVQTRPGSPETGNINGLRLQYMPEYDPNFNPANSAEIMQEKTLLFLEVLDTIMKGKKIDQGIVVHYETTVYNKGTDY